MKKLFLLVSLLMFGIAGLAQDALTTELFSADNIMKYQTEINLTESQSAAIKEHYNNGNKNFSDAKWKLSAEKAKLDKMLKASKVDESAAMAQMTKVTQLEQEVKMSRLQTLVKIKNELSEDQQAKLKEMITDKDRKAFYIATDINDEKKVKLQVSGSKKSGPSPLYIIKNKTGDREVTNAVISDLDPDNIESLVVLKGDSAIKLYGSKGKNGVIEIKLKNKY